MVQPLTGIKAYFINNKPLYSAFLSDVVAQGGTIDSFPEITDIPDGSLSKSPWVGIVIEKNTEYTGDTSIYSNVWLLLNTNTYTVVWSGTEGFETALLASFYKSDGMDSFQVPEQLATTKGTVALSYWDIPYNQKVICSIPMKPGLTSFREIIENYGNLFTDDVRNQEELNLNPASFLNNSAYYLKAAIPRFNMPDEIKHYLAQRSEPDYTEYYWSVPYLVLSDGEEQTPTTEPTIIQTGNTGYEVCSVVIRGVDKFGNPVDNPFLDAEYNNQTGEVTFPTGLIRGTEFVICFYLDGYFLNPISGDMKRILGLCFKQVWEYRFSGEWLARAAKQSDKTFTPPNEANWTRAQEEKRRSEEESLNQEIRAYEQMCAYRGTVGSSKSITLV